MPGWRWDPAPGRVVPVAAEHQPGDVHAGFQPAGAAPGVIVEPGILNGDPGGGGQGDSQAFVLGSEVAAVFLLGQIQVAENHVPDPHRDTEEGLHGWMVCREAVGFRMAAQVMEPKGAGFGNQQAQDAVAGGKRPDPVGQFLVDAHGDEVAEGAVVADDAQGPVPGMKQPAGGLHNAFQHGIEAEVLGYCDHGLQQPGHPLLGLEQFLGPGHKTLEHPVNHGLWLSGGLVRMVPH